MGGGATLTNGTADGPVSRGNTAPLKLEEFLPYRLNVLANLVSQALSRIYGDRYGIGVPEWRVLVTLGQYGMMTGKAVGAHSHMHKTKVSRAGALLEKGKMVVRRADLRESFLSLTPAGSAVYEDLAPTAPLSNAPSSTSLIAPPSSPQNSQRSAARSKTTSPPSDREEGQKTRMPP